MVAYSFKARFAPLIVDGTKRHTLRNDRKRHARAGETLQIYTGMRTRSCRLIGLATCQAVRPCRLDFDARTVEIQLPFMPVTPEPDAFAVSDGFADWDDMAAFWAAEHPGLRQWSGVLIAWGDSFRLPAASA